MPLNCVKCGSPIEPHSGPGRPAAYCGEVCRRLVEFEVRRIDRRLAGYEIEHRGLLYDGPDEFDDTERQKRLRALRRWMQVDEERLRHLLGNDQRSATDSGPSASKQSGNTPRSHS